jgi:hypothetical protein
MRRPARLAAPLIALALLAPIGCNPSADPVELPDLETPQYGPPAGTDDLPVNAPEPDSPAFADPGQPPSEEGVPTNAGGTSDVDEQPGSFNLSPPSDLQDQPPSEGPAGEGPESPATPTAEAPEEPGIGRP